MILDLEQPWGPVTSFQSLGGPVVDVVLVEAALGGGASEDVLWSGGDVEREGRWCLPSVWTGTSTHSLSLETSTLAL